MESAQRFVRVRTPSRLTVAACALGGAALLGAVLLGSIVAIALVAAVIVAAAAIQGARLSGRRWRRGEVLARGVVFASLNLASAIVRRAFRPRYVFVIYAETDRDKRLYFPAWVERLLRPVFPSGLIRFGRSWGLAVAGKSTAQSFEAEPELLAELLDRTRRRHPDVDVIALAGRLPSIAAAKGVPLDPPFLRGTRGTLCALTGAARSQAEMLGTEPAATTIGVAGGAGFVGRQLVDALAEEFGGVVALDPRFAGARERRGNVLYTDRPADMEGVRAVLVLTTRGEEIEGLIPFLAPGAIVADDTHPEIPEELRRRLADEAGATVLKASVGDPRCRIVPRIPIFRADDIPGCLVEALVVVEHGREVLASQAAFDAAARDIGLDSRLAPHISGRAPSSRSRRNGASPQATAEASRRTSGGTGRFQRSSRRFIRPAGTPDQQPDVAADPGLR